MPGWRIDHSKPTALYGLYDAAGELLYIGIGFVPETRWRAHAKTAWGPLVTRREVQWFPDRRKARAEELRLIRSLQPPHNVAETPRKLWMVQPRPLAVPTRRPKALPAAAGNPEDVLVRLARQVRRSARARCRLEIWLAIEYEAGASLRAVAADAGLSHEGVRKILVRRGVPIRARGRS